jgi:hypothetical protein
MVRQVDAQRRMPRAAAAALIALVCGVTACGGGDDFADDPPSPPPITLSAAISPERVTVTPARLAAGTIELIASNQTATSQRVTLRSAGSGGALEQSTGPINPGDTASLTADLTAGRYVVTAHSPAIAPARIVVRAARGAPADGLLQP